MPYPAVNVNGASSGPWQLTSNYSSWVYNGTASFRRVGQVHPASTSNPIQPDGTRAMSAWRHYGGWWRSPSNADGVAKVGSWEQDYYKGCIETAVLNPASLQVWDGGRDAARLKALASWSERQVEYSDALRTAGQTAGMVGDLGKGLAHELLNASDKYGRNIARHWKKLPGWYLQYLYGWKPLMDDISNITDRLVKGLDAGNSLHVTLKGKWSGRGEIITDNAAGGSWGSVWNVDTYWDLIQRNSCTMKYAFPSDRLPNLQPMGFFGGLWEASPFSFVIDWVAPVGDWLKALDANTLAIYFVEGSSSEVVKVVGVRSEHRSLVAIDAQLRRFETEIIRTPYNFTRTLETPWSITSRVPFRADLNLNHAAQGLSLLSQALNRLW